MNPDNPTAEFVRLQTLHSYQILDTPPEDVFDDLVRLVAQVCETPIAAIAFIDAHRQWFKASIGLAQREMARSLAICDHTIQSKMPLRIVDFRQTPHFAQNPLLLDKPQLCFYAGVPLLAPDGMAVGTLFVMDTTPRQLNPAQQNTLQVMAKQVISQMELRTLQHKHKESLAAKAQAESALLRYTEHLRLAQRIAHLGSWEHDIGANRSHWSDEVYRIFGTDPRLFVGTFEAFLNFVHEDDRAAYLAARTKTLAGDASIDHVYRIVRPNGEIRHVHFRGERLVTADGIVAGLAGTVQDITEQLRSTRALFESEQRFARLFSSAAAGITLSHPQGNFIQVNPAFCEMVGYSEADLCVLDYLTITHPDDRQQNAMLIQQLLAGEVDSFVLEKRYVTKGGGIVWARASISCVYSDVDEPLYVIAVTEDITERVNAQEVATSLKERLATTLENMTDAFCILDREWRMTYLNKEGERLILHTAEQVHNVTLWERFPPTTRSELYHHFFRAVNEQQPAHFELYYPPLNNWFEVHAHPLSDGLAVYFRIITERKLAEQALRESSELLRASEQQYRLLFTSNPHPMWVFDLETLRFLAVNERAIAQYGYAEEEFLAMTILDIRTADEVPRVMQALQQLTPHRDFVQWRHRKKDGTLIDVEVSSDAILFNGRKARLVLANDVTARRHAEEKVRQQAALLDKARDAILVRGLDHKVQYWNRGAERLYGWSAEEVAGRPVTELLYRDPEIFARAHQQLLANGEWFAELQQIDRQGRDILVEVHWTLVHDEEGKPQAVLAINTDITERKRLEAQFLRAQRMESIGTLAGGIAHDLNNVLAPILLSLGMLKRQSKTPVEQKLLATLESSAQRGADMVRQVLSFARGVEGERVVVDVGTVVRDLENLIRDTFDRSISFTVDVGEDHFPVLGDPTQIHQVVLNLCVNARDAMPNGGELRVAVACADLDSPFASMDQEAEPGRYVILRVIDTGMGIPPAIRDRIFDPFFTTKELGKGTGLGLPTVQAVLKSHGGFINVYSEEGRGTEFRIYLPALERAVGDNPSTQAMPLANSNGELVLVIDDEPAIRLITQQTLESFGYRVLTAESGVDAIATYAKYKTDIAVVLTDMMMPQMDGIALIHALRGFNPDVKVIAASGLADIDTVAKASRVGVNHFLQKPYTMESLLKVLAEMREEMSSTI